MPTRINPRITIKKHERIVAKLKLNHALDMENLEVWRGMAEAKATYNHKVVELLYKWIDRAGTEIRYAHSNIRAGNVEEAGKYLAKARAILNQ